MTGQTLLNAVIFATLGVAVFAVAAAILLKLAPFRLWHEIVEEKNIAVAIFAGAVAIALGLVVAAAMH